MNDSKANEDAAEPRLDCRVGRKVRRRVVGVIAGYQSWTCVLECGHFADTGRWVTSYGATRPAPKTMQCKACSTVPNGQGKPTAVNELNEGENT